MKTTTFIATILASASVTMAVPALLYRQIPVPVCTGTTGNAQCCATDVLGLADLDCANPPSTPSNRTEFIDICAVIGQRARCCAIPILGQALICGDPV
ncbi:hypothetical protein K402DRAFT_320569 [Aulographum hederae CBS 113979]|uniref:Hydrophobin n=1 Tax=Aulographum hederae CBS 113979 TaxID=1176131 RepID=A0A6G1HGL1_9PEZI|nr:hypothetical protein K402DRAFT_320569 [Aulographum hederae CBS 113979]